MSETKNQFAGTLLLILTIAAIVSAVICFRQLRSFPLHDDGVTWVDRADAHGNKVVAAYMSPDGPGDVAGIRLDDQLVKIQDFPIHSALDVPQALAQVQTWENTRYTLRRNCIEFQKAGIFIQAAPRDSAVYYQFFVGFFYLAIGFLFITAAPALRRVAISSSSV